MLGYSIYDIALWFLTKDSMSPQKLQKLCYYAEAWSQALLDKPLIRDEHFQAWAHGPVSTQIYHVYKSFGWQDIPKASGDAIQIDDPKVADLLESVWVTYGDKSANELEALTHSEDPWILARRRGNAGDGDKCNEEILAEDMAKYYKSIYIGD